MGIPNFETQLAGFFRVISGEEKPLQRLLARRLEKLGAPSRMGNPWLGCALMGKPWANIVLKKQPGVSLQSSGNKVPSGEVPPVCHVSRTPGEVRVELP